MLSNMHHQLDKTGTFLSVYSTLRKQHQHLFCFNADVYGQCVSFSTTFSLLYFECWILNHSSIISHTFFVKPLSFSVLSLPVFGRSVAMRWRLSLPTASGGWLCPGRRYSGWTLHVSVKWRTWLTSPVSMKPQCCTTWEKDTTLVWYMWVYTWKGEHNR